MPVNPYFQQSKGGFVEAPMYENLIVEAIQINGNLFYYIPRQLNNFDAIYGEDVLSSFNSAVPIEMYLENVNGYEGESEMISKFGLEIRDSATLVLARKRWNESIKPLLEADPNSTKTDLQKARPTEGDLIFFPITKSLFEIKFVEDDEPFYQLEKKFIWKLRVELFQYNNETIATGESSIDDVFNIFNRNRLDFAFVLENSSGVMLAEDGGTVLQEAAITDTDIADYGNNNPIQSEFNDIFDFSDDNPFSEKF
ncbi:head completion, neck hetero-dimeric protein [Synechococcus phage BUCT-ZZ01]|nr:head completion, neck hetero-dimeric protein [Synechococcus phage BUCT-ZZ01]